VASQKTKYGRHLQIVSKYRGRKCLQILQYSEAHQLSLSQGEGSNIRLVTSQKSVPYCENDGQPIFEKGDQGTLQPYQLVESKLPHLGGRGRRTYPRLSPYGRFHRRDLSGGGHRGWRYKMTLPKVADARGFAAARGVSAARGVAVTQNAGVSEAGMPGSICLLLGILRGTQLCTEY
jgi:hypothetical protein